MTAGRAQHRFRLAIRLVATCGGFGEHCAPIEKCVTHLVVKGHNMQVPLDITFQNSEPSETIRSEVERQAKRLEKFYDRITSCHVTIVAPTMRRRKGELFAINIRVAIPQHKDILVSKTHGDAPEHEHIMVAIKDAFAAAQRQHPRIWTNMSSLDVTIHLYIPFAPGFRGARSRSSASRMECGH